MAGARQGYLTLAVGRTRYLEMAVDLALSLREFDTRPIALATDAALEAEALERYPGVFSSIHLVEPRFLSKHWVWKFGVACATPFEETVFLDADCLIVADPESVWTGAGPEAITMMGQMLTRDLDRWHGGFSTRVLMERFGLERYLKTNSGVFHFRRAGAADLFEECLRCYEQEVLVHLVDDRHPPAILGDELAFAIVGGRRRFGRYPVPVPQHWAHEIGKLDLSCLKKPVLHFVAPVPQDLLEVLMRSVSRRRREAGFSPAVSIPHWRTEARFPGWLKRTKRWIHRRLKG